MNLGAQELLGAKGVKAPAPVELMPTDNPKDTMSVIRTGLGDNPTSNMEMTMETGLDLANRIGGSAIVKLRTGITKIRYAVAHCLAIVVA